MRRHPAITPAITLPLLFLLSACGYKGPLYLPPPNPATSRPPASTQAPAPKPATPPATMPAPPGQPSGNPAIRP